MRNISTTVTPDFLRLYNANALLAVRVVHDGNYLHAGTTCRISFRNAAADFLEGAGARDTEPVTPGYGEGETQGSQGGRAHVNITTLGEGADMAWWD